MTIGFCIHFAIGSSSNATFTWNGCTCIGREESDADDSDGDDNDYATASSGEEEEKADFSSQHRISLVTTKQGKINIHLMYVLSVALRSVFV